MMKKPLKTNKKRFSFARKIIFNHFHKKKFFVSHIFRRRRASHATIFSWFVKRAFLVAFASLPCAIFNKKLFLDRAVVVVVMVFFFVVCCTFFLIPCDANTFFHYKSLIIIRFIPLHL